MAPDGKILEQAWMVAPETVRLMAALHLDGGDARFVGGCVRDALCNRTVADVDIATPLKPDEVMARLKTSEIPFAPTGLKHGTVTAIVDGKPFEITTLRIDKTPYGRHAEVQFTCDWTADAARRDFTINALSMNLLGEVFDPFGGIRDLAEGRVVFVGEPEKRIAEDVLRILRFYRFTAHFGREGTSLAGRTACAAQAHLLPRLSPERVRQEVLKILEAPRAADIWRMMIEDGASGYILPEATDTAALDRLVDLEESWGAGAHPLRRLAALLVVNPEGLEHVEAALRLSNEQAAQLRAMALSGRTPPATDAAGARRLAYTVGADMARNFLLLSAARGGPEDTLEKCFEAATAFRPPRFPLKGEDALKLRIPPGPDIGRVLKEMENWWAEQDFQPGRTACLEKLKERCAAKG